MLQPAQTLLPDATRSTVSVLLRMSGRAGAGTEQQRLDGKEEEWRRASGPRPKPGREARLRGNAVRAVGLIVRTRISATMPSSDLHVCMCMPAGACRPGAPARSAATAERGEWRYAWLGT